MKSLADSIKEMEDTLEDCRKVTATLELWKQIYYSSNKQTQKQMVVDLLKDMKFTDEEIKQCLKDNDLTE